jgi:hypothetical protein
MDLSGFDLRWVDLQGASLRGTNFEGANLTWASAPDADFADAYFGETVLGGTNLSAAKNLARTNHRAPSIIDHWAFQNSWPLDLTFLRGCGVPDSIIDYYGSVFTQAIRFYSCFISYSSRDQEFAERLHADLQNKGVRCWFAPEDLKIGDTFRQRIDESIRLHDKLLLILSEHSVNSPWVQDEVEAALERERREKRLVLFPIRIDGAVMETEQAWAASVRRTRHIGDFTRWKDHDSYRKAFERLMRDLEAEAEAG